MEKKRYIKPCSVVIYDCGISLMESSPYKVYSTYTQTVNGFTLNVDEDVYGVYDESNIPTPNEAKMHDLWEEW